jgi:hypothetical protein
VKDLTGRPLKGPVELSFAVYQQQTSAEPLWQETQTLTLDEQGHYSALLGSMHPEGLPLDLFIAGEARWLGVTAGNLPEQPRVLIVSVPYALKAGDAETLGGKPASAFLLAAPAQGSTPSGTSSAATTAVAAMVAQAASLVGSGVSKPRTVGSGSGGTANYVAKWSDGTNDLGNSVLFDNVGKKGAGEER